jgi:hypothetical protein
MKLKTQKTRPKSNIPDDQIRRLKNLRKELKEEWAQQKEIGTITHYNSESRYGFIDNTIFFRNPLIPITIGTKVSFVHRVHNGKSRAINVALQETGVINK